MFTNIKTSQPGPCVSQDELRTRRAKFLAKLPPGSVAFIVANPERTRSNDTEFPYRQSSDVFYLTAFPEPEAVVILTNIEGEEPFQMVVRPKDRDSEIWTGIRQGVEGAKANFGAGAAFTLDKFKEVASRLMGKAKTVYYKTGRNEEFDKLFNEVWSARQRTLSNPEEILHEQRLFKSAEEIALMRHAAEISAHAHCQAMLVCAPGLREYQLQAVLEGTFLWHGAKAPAYGSIVGGGNNAVVLHYVENDRELKDGDLVLIDAACEYQGYASDITRTFPVSGKFSPAQREIYDLVLKSQEAAVRATRAGVTLASVHETAQRVLRQGLVKLGILPKGARTKKSKKGKTLTLGDFYMHGTSHWIGMDVHDVGSYSTETGDTNRRGSRKRLLEPGMVITVEPGLYFDKDDKRVPAKYRGIGIRIEDDVVVTESGNTVLTAGVPKDADEIERLMAGPSPVASPRRECGPIRPPVGVGDEDVSFGER